MGMTGAEYVTFKDGRNLEQVISSIGGTGTSVDLSEYAKTTDIEKEITDLKASIPSVDGLAKETEIVDLTKKVEAIVIPDVSGLAKASDVTSLTEVVNQLISDLKAGKYNVSGSTTATSTTDTGTK